MNITERLNALGYKKKGCFEHGYIEGRSPFGQRGYTIFAIVLDVGDGSEVINKRSYPNPEDLHSWQQNLTVPETELALEIIYCYREWKSSGGCKKCMHFDKEDFKCKSKMKGECHV